MRGRLKIALTVHLDGQIRVVDRLSSAQRGCTGSIVPDREGHPAFRALRAHDRGDLDELLDMLTSTDSRERIWGAIYLGNLGDPRATDLLLRALRSDDKNVRLFTLSALGRIGVASTADTIVELGLADENLLVRCACGEALVKIGDRRAIGVYTSLLNQPRGHVPFRRRFVVQQLVELHGADALPALEAAKGRAGFIQRLRLRRAIATLKRQAA
jgi:HEAT repeat protein